MLSAPGMQVAEKDHEKRRRVCSEARRVLSNGFRTPGAVGPLSLVKRVSGSLPYARVHLLCIARGVVCCLTASDSTRPARDKSWLLRAVAVVAGTAGTTSAARGAMTPNKGAVCPSITKQYKDTRKQERTTHTKIWRWHIYAIWETIGQSTDDRAKNGAEREERSIGNLWVNNATH
jgi:hypothetical protein